MTPIIRRIEPKDYQDVHLLNTRLGYEYNEEKVHERIQNILETGNDIIMVAECDDKVVGYIHGCPYNTLYTDALCSIVAFVFSDDTALDASIMDLLLHAFEDYAHKNGYFGIRLAADVSRERLYNVMIRNHYENKRDLKHYIKYF